MNCLLFRYLKNIPNKQKLAAELAFLEKELSSLPAEVGFAHNDLLVKNIIYNEEKGNNKTSVSF